MGGPRDEPTQPKRQNQYNIVKLKNKIKKIKNLKNQQNKYTCVYIYLSQFAVQQKLIQHCKSTILQ